MIVQNKAKTITVGQDEYKSPAEILENLKKLGPLIEQQAEEIDRLRHLTPRMLEALRKAGAFRIAWPAAWGGPEMRFDDQIRAVESLSYYDASVAWNVQILSDTGFYAAQFPFDVAQELYGSMDCATAGGFFPPQRANRVEGGWHIPKGRWPFGSGIHSADQVVCGINLYDNGELLHDSDGEAAFRVAYLPSGKVKLLDTWYTLGLRGSGSTDYEVEDVFVPDRHVFQYFGGVVKHLPPLSRHPEFIGISIQGVVLGLGRRILDDLRDQLLKRSSNDRFLRIRYAEAEMHFNAARTFSISTAAKVSDRLFAGQDLTPEEIAAVSLSTINAALQTKEACAIAIELVGSASIYARSPFERRRRDLETAMAHNANQRRTLEGVGGRLLGDEKLPQIA